MTVLKGDDGFKNSIVSSLYYKRPFYLISSSCYEIKWVNKNRKLRHKQLGGKSKIPFYSINAMDFYSNNTKNVNISDKLITQYWWHNWIIKRK